MCPLIEKSLSEKKVIEDEKVLRNKIIKWRNKHCKIKREI